MLHRFVGEGDRFLKRQAFLGNADYLASALHKFLEKRVLVPVAFALQQLGLRAVFAGLNVAHFDQSQVEGGRVTAPLEPHQVRSREPQSTVNLAHVHSPFLRDST